MPRRPIDDKRLFGKGRARLSEAVFLNYSQAELDRAYDQRAWAPNADALIAGWKDRAGPAQAAHPGFREVSYGAGANERLDLYATSVPGAPIHVYIHGGAWRAQSKDDGAFVAETMTAAGMHFVVPEFDKLPDVRMPVMVDQLIGALRWVYQNAGTFGGNREQILLSGHSSGAHLAAVLATLDWRAYDLPADLLSGLVCISGAYDLEPVLLSARRSYIDLTASEADWLSAPRHVSAIRCPVRVLVGEKETPEFIRQAHAFAEILSADGKLQDFVEVPGCNHFEIFGQMGDPGSQVFGAIAASLTPEEPAVG